jgi:hypothetical protein
MNSQSTINARSVFSIMMDIPKMKTSGGIIITNDGERIETEKVYLNLQDNMVYFNNDGSIPIYSISEVRPLNLDCELPTKRDEAPIDYRDDEVGEISINPPCKLVRSYAENDLSIRRKRKFEEISDDEDTEILNDDERPEFFEPSPRKMKKETIEDVFNKLEEDHIKLARFMIQNNVNILNDSLNIGYKVNIKIANNGQLEENTYNVIYLFESGDNHFVILSRNDRVLTHVNITDIMSILPSIRKFYEEEPISIKDRDYWRFLKTCMNGENVYVHRKTGISVMEEEDGKLHFQGMCDDEKYTMEEMKKIANWVKRCGFEVIEIHNKQPEIPQTPIKKNKEMQPPMAPRKPARETINNEISSAARKLDFSSEVKQEVQPIVKPIVQPIVQPTVKKEEIHKNKPKTYLDIIVESIKELKQRGGCSRPLIIEYIRRKYNKNSPLNSCYINKALKRGVEEGILVQNKQHFKLGSVKQEIPKVSSKDNIVTTFLKQNIDKKVKFNYKEQPKVVIVKSIDDYHLMGICQRDNHIKKYNLIYICDLEVVNDAPREQSHEVNKKVKVTDTTILEELKNNKYKTIQIIYKDEVKTVTPRCFTEKMMYAICEKDNILKRYIIDNISTVISKNIKKENSVEDILRESMNNKEAIFIKYSKGSIPDIKRPIRVKAFQTTRNNKTMVISECLIEDSIRKFDLEHIEIVA